MTFKQVPGVRLWLHPPQSFARRLILRSDASRLQHGSLGCGSHRGTLRIIHLSRDGSGAPRGRGVVISVRCISWSKSLGLTLCRWVLSEAPRWGESWFVVRSHSATCLSVILKPKTRSSAFFFFSLNKKNLQVFTTLCRVCFSSVTAFL